MAIISKPNSSAYAAWQFTALGEVLDALDRGGKSLEKLQMSAGPELRNAIQRLDGLFAEARRITSSPTSIAASNSVLTATFRILARDVTHKEQDLELLANFLQPQFPMATQRAALAGVRRTSEKHAAQL